MALKPPKGCIDESDPRVAQFGHPAPAWLFPYADLMTELVCFFVILYALSAALDPAAQKGKEEIDKVMDEQGVAGEVTLTKEGLRVSMTEEGGFSFFESGFAELTPKMRETLAKMAVPLKGMAEQNKMILVEGYTDNIPIHNDYFWSNWELSTARATSVVEYFINERGFPPACMAAMGFGEHQPKCKENSHECRSRNRRVEFLVRSPGLGTNICSGKPTPKPAPKAERGPPAQEKKET
ncbi:MAG: flagellar motor protein MotB [Elusimicrobiota bacterium]